MNFNYDFIEREAFVDQGVELEHRLRLLHIVLVSDLPGVLKNLLGYVRHALLLVFHVQNQYHPC